MDEPWESSIVEYGVVNVTGFRIVDPARRYVRDFLKKWTLLDPTNFPGAGRNSISVCAIDKCEESVCMVSFFPFILILSLMMENKDRKKICLMSLMMLTLRTYNVFFTLNLLGIWTDVFVDLTLGVIIYFLYSLFRWQVKIT